MRVNAVNFFSYVRVNIVAQTNVSRGYFTGESCVPDRSGKELDGNEVK